MIYDLSTFGVLGLGSQGTSPRPDGNHLRWGFTRSLPFPDKGFTVYRRTSQRLELSCVDFRHQRIGQRYSGEFQIPPLRFWTAQPAEIVDAVPAAGQPEMFLRLVKGMRIVLPLTADLVRLSMVTRAFVHARAYAGGVLVAETEMRRRAGDMELSRQGIDLIVIDAAETLLVRICYASASLKIGEVPERQGWERIAGPLMLPATFTEGRPRILGDPAPIERAYRDWMQAAIDRLLDPADPAPPQERGVLFLEGRGLVSAGTSPGGRAAFQARAQTLLLLAAIDPDIARFLGLGFVDQSATPDAAYDYLVVGRWSTEPRYAYVLQLVRAPAPLLDPPAGLSATSFATGVAKPGQTGMAVGLRWALPLAGTGYLISDSPVSYDVRRLRAAPATDPVPPAPASLTFPSAPANDYGRIIVSRRPSVDGPDAYPEFYFVDFERPEAWWAYQAKGYDIFGRESGWSGTAFARVLDLVPPPAPTTLLEPQPGPGVPASEFTRLPVQARYVDPADPALTPADQTLVATHGGPVTVVEWNWLREQHELAADTKEFRVYRHPSFRGAPVQIASVGTPTATSVTVTLDGPPPFDTVGGDLSARGASYAIVAQSGAVLTILPQQIGRPDGTLELVAPVPGPARVIEATRDARRWRDRLHAEPVDPVKPAKLYRVVLPGATLAPTVADPVASAWIGVTAADDKAYVPDDPTRTGPLAGRHGNESPIAVRSRILAVDRTAPAAPPAPAGAQYASRADFHGKSRYTLAWTVAPPSRYHVYRSTESSVVASDLAARQARAGHYAANSPFGDDPGFPVWLSAEFPDLTAADLHASPRTTRADAAWKTWAARFYNRTTLADVQLQSIAGRSPNEAAFTQLTTEPIAAGRYDDVVDGRIAGRYVYRIQAVNPNGLKGPLSPALQPVRLHDVVPPRAPVVSRLAVGDRSATLEWTPSIDLDLDHYEVYRRRRDGATAIDTRLMERRGGNLGAAQTSLDDTGLQPGQEYVYVVVAVDATGNRSEPSEPRSVRGIATTPPSPPTASATRVPGTAEIVVNWTTPEDTARALVERREASATSWVRVSGWLDPGITSFTDTQAPSTAAEYRVKLLDGAGHQSDYSAVAAVA